MRDVMAQARLKHAEPFGYADSPAVAIRQCNRAATAFKQRAGAARQHDKAKQAEIADQEIISDVVKRLLLGRVPDVPYRKVFGAPRRIGAEVKDLSAALV